MGVRIWGMFCDRIWWLGRMMKYYMGGVQGAIDQSE